MTIASRHQRASATYEWLDIESISCFEYISPTNLPLLPNFDVTMVLQCLANTDDPRQHYVTLVLHIFSIAVHSSPLESARKSAYAYNHMHNQLSV